MTAELRLFGITGIGEIRAGDDLADLLVAALTQTGERLLDGDILVVSSKVISKAEGRVVPARTRDAQVVAETVRPVAARRTPTGVARIVQAAAGPVMAAAGVDASNVDPGTVLLLPANPDEAARALRRQLRERTGTRIGVIISDTAGRAWRDGQTDFALGAAGVTVTDDLRGSVDTHGQPLEVTVRALADELAAAADLVKGKLKAVPAAIVRGLPTLVTDADSPGAAALLRPVRTDWFRQGHVEAVRAALGVQDGDVEPPAVPADSGPVRLARVLELAQTGALSRGVTPEPRPLRTAMVLAGPIEPEAGGGYRVDLPVVVDVIEPEYWLHLGMLAERIRVAAWSEDLTVRITLRPGSPPGLRISAADAWAGPFEEPGADE